MHDQAELAAFGALPRVLKRGILIKETGNHKYRGYDTITLAAPVIINGVRGNMAVVVKKTADQRYSTHRIVMPDGSAFIYKNSAESSTARGVAITGSYASPIDSASNNSIRRADAEVNPEIQKSAREPNEVSGQFHYDDVQHSARVTDEETLDFLDNQDTVTTYKTMQLVDGKLYPPMCCMIS